MRYSLLQEIRFRKRKTKYQYNIIKERGYNITVNLLFEILHLGIHDIDCFRKSETLIPNIFNFLVMLSYEKFHSKPVITMPKIIQLCDGIMASGLDPTSHGGNKGFLQILFFIFFFKVFISLKISITIVIKATYILY